ncbi:hypothetical protein KAFR_0C05180 [Kazachstania africana CBS 2517]|uniref:BHLH domain-containing protein n=1 Tax=Kazachstania africana (strain ATCC 22294 / BCRC 22015 / CBS 2517 / CECT 1963 / NBRC 1671 / NRRL Y-8276) TaxID=1071382 RepID=H2AT09_KAZAF|nr:hypothetical protein KAFR_0C05180 [Kazachstania africana CBS 2517]CCF57509.1 hypothetical protein KAFR_0C05180 [Kazachstania africana CBS 2517]
MDSIITNDAANFESWMFEEDMKPSLVSNKNSSISLNSNLTTDNSWFESLENIISSTSSSSIASPIENQLNQEVPFTLKQENESFIPSLVNSPENDSFTNDVSLLPSLDNLIKREITESDEADGEDDGLIKIRPVRKRLTAHQKEAHNKIEKRYRININTKIARLQQIIPWVSSEQTAFEVSDSVKKQDASISTTTATSTRLNKSMILEKAVDYILYLQNNERLYELEVTRLKNEVETLRRQSNQK